MLDGFYVLVAPDAPAAEMASRVLGQMGPRASRRRRLAVALAAAAVVLVAVVPLWRGVPSREAKRQPQQVAAINPGLQRMRLAWEAYSPTPSLFVSDAPAGQRYSNVAKETGQSLASVVLYVPGVGGMSGGILADQGGSETSTWRGRVSESLRPLTSSVSQTLGLLLGAWPPDGVSSRS